MNLDEMIEALRTIREHVPGDTPVEMEYRYPDYRPGWEGETTTEQMGVDSVGFIPSPPEGEQQRVTIR
jgi:hypothetical protein